MLVTLSVPGSSEYIKASSCRRRRCGCHRRLRLRRYRRRCGSRCRRRCCPHRRRHCSRRSCFVVAPVIVVDVIVPFAFRISKVRGCSYTLSGLGLSVLHLGSSRQQREPGVLFCHATSRKRAPPCRRRDSQVLLPSRTWLSRASWNTACAC